MNQVQWLFFAAVFPLFGAGCFAPQAIYENVSSRSGDTALLQLDVSFENLDSRIQITGSGTAADPYEMTVISEASFREISFETPSNGSQSSFKVVQPELQCSGLDGAPFFDSIEQDPMRVLIKPYFHLDDQDENLVWSFYCRVTRGSEASAKAYFEIKAKNNRTTLVTRPRMDNGPFHGEFFQLVQSGNGRYLFFLSEQLDLVKPYLDFGERFYPYRLDLQTGELIRLGSADGVPFWGVSSFYTVSSDGDTLYFTSDEALDSNDDNSVYDIYRYQISTQTITLVTKDKDGGIADGPSALIAMTPDGKYLVIQSRATDLVAGDTNARIDVFRYDVAAETIALVSLADDEQLGDQNSTGCGISDDGNLVMFKSQSTNLVASDTNAKLDAFIRNVSAGTTTRVSTRNGGTQSNQHISHCAINGDGTVVLFTANDGNFVAGDTNLKLDLFLKELGNTNTHLISQGTGGISDGATDTFQVSKDGSLVYFVNAGTNLVAGDDNEAYDLFVRDWANATTTLLSERDGTLAELGVSIGTMGAGLALNGGDGIYFTSKSRNLVDATLKFATHIYYRDLTTGKIQLVFDNPASLVGTATGTAAKVSNDGKYVAFVSSDMGDVLGTSSVSTLYLQNRATGELEVISKDHLGVAQAILNAFDMSDDLRYFVFASNKAMTADDVDTNFDIFLVDRQLDTITRVSTDSSGTAGNDDSLAPVISGDGRYVAFVSNASNLVAGDTNGGEDVFRKDLVTGTTICVTTETGGGMGTAAPANTMAAINEDGNYIAFLTEHDLDAADGNGLLDVYVKKIDTNTTYLISQDTNGIPVGVQSLLLSLSENGTRVAFVSDKALLASDTNTKTDVYVCDLPSTCQVASLDSDGNEVAWNVIHMLTMSGDGNFVLFHDFNGPDWFPGDSNGRGDYFLKNLGTGEIDIANRNHEGELTEGEGLIVVYPGAASLSYDGRYGTFMGDARSLVPDDFPNLYSILYMRQFW